MNTIAVYTDELDEEPDTACQKVRGIGLFNVVIRRVWGSGIANTTDENCKKVLTAVKKHGVKVACLATDDGRVPAHELGSPELVARFRRNLILANYFHAKQMRVYAGLRTNKESPENVRPKVRNWMNLVAQECRASNIVPVLEIEPEAYDFEPRAILSLLQETQEWRLLYDPALLMLRRNHDHVTSYWSVLKNYVSSIDLHDCLPNAGFVPVGGGQCLWPALIEDCVAINYSGLVFVEPGPSRRGGKAVVRTELCTTVLNNYGKLVKDATAAFREKHKKRK